MDDSKTQEIETGHEYDGIRELDNPLPAWWLATFFATIIFGFHYWLHYSIAGGQSQAEELRAGLARLEARQKSAGPLVETEDELKAMAANDDLKAKGHEVYIAKCAACHGPDLQGVIGPNLTDEYWLHGQGRLTGIIATIRGGVLDKGMPAWDAQLPPGDIQALVAFVSSKQGSNPPNPKPPQGERVAN